jgi:hypothetical protein
MKVQRFRAQLQCRHSEETADREQSYTREENSAEMIPQKGSASEK